MAKIRTFRAIMPAKEYVQRVAALPYDVFDRAEARVEAEKDPLSFLNIDRPETQFEEGHDMYAPEVYEKASEMLEEEIRRGIFAEDEKSALYLYRLTMNGRSQTGIVGCASIDDYLEGVVRKHENTRKDKLEDRIRHVDVCGMQTGPIFLTYRQDPVIAGVTRRVCGQEPLFDFVSDDGIRHTGWRMDSSEDIKTVQEAFGGMECVYIADGHHRAESAVRAGLMRRERHAGKGEDEEYSWFLSVLFPSDELMIMDYNRLVKDLGGRTPGQVLAELEKVCRLRESSVDEKPAEKGQFQVFIDRKWYMAEFSGERPDNDPVAGLDVSMLQDRVLQPLFGISDPKTDERIAFIGGIRGAAELQTRAEECGGIAFRMYPTAIDELMEVADCSLLMPPKSTWFEPKLRSGLFLHRIGR